MTGKLIVLALAATTGWSSDSDLVDRTCNLQTDECHYVYAQETSLKGRDKWFDADVVFVDIDGNESLVGKRRYLVTCSPDTVRVTNDTAKLRMPADSHRKRILDFACRNKPLERATH